MGCPLVAWMGCCFTATFHGVAPCLTCFAGDVPSDMDFLHRTIPKSGETKWRRARNMSKMTQGLSQENLGSHLSLPSSWARGSRFKDVQGEEKPDQS